MQKLDMLIVEDEPAIQEFLKAALSDDCHIHLAGRGDKALEIAAAHPPDIILLDVGLPDMTGYEICRRLKADPRFDKTPVIFLTSYSDPDKELRGIEAGGIDYISKPINILMLRARLKNHFVLLQPPRRTRQPEGKSV